MSQRNRLAEGGSVQLRDYPFPLADSRVQLEYEIAGLSCREQKERLRPPAPVMMVQAAGGAFDVDEKDIAEFAPLLGSDGDSERQQDGDLGLLGAAPQVSAPGGAGARAAGTPGGATSRAELTRLWKEGVKDLLDRIYSPALANFERLLREDPDTNHHHAYTWNAAWCQVQLGNFHEALHLFMNYPTLARAKADKIAKAKEYVLFLMGAPNSGIQSRTQAAATIKRFTAAQKKLSRGAAKFKKAGAAADAATARGKQTPGWLGPALKEIHAIGQPFHDALDQAKQKMTPGIHTWDMLVDNIVDFATEYDSIADLALEVASGTKSFPKVKTDILKGRMALLILYLPPGMGMLAQPLGTYFSGLRPTVLKLYNDLK